MKLTLTLFVAVPRTASLCVTETQLEAAIIELLGAESIDRGRLNR